MIKVNGQEIPEAAIEFELNRLLRFYSEHMSEDQVRAQIGVLKERAKDQAIGAKLLFDEADRLDIPVSDDDVRRHIEQLTEEAGGEERFREMIAKQGSNSVMFAEQVRRGRRVDKLVEQVTSGISDPDEETIREHYHAHLDEYTKAERARAQHILIECKPDASEEERDRALARVAELQDKLADGADFAELAAGYSACPSGKQSGGSLGWFGRGAMVPEFDEAVFSMKEGDVSKPVKTDFGFHLIKKTGYQPEEKPTFDEARDRIREFLRHAARGDALSAFVAELREKAVIEQS